MIYTDRVREHLIAANVSERDGYGSRYLMAAVRLPVGTNLDDEQIYPPCYNGHEGAHEECPVCLLSDAVTVATSLAFFGFDTMPQSHIDNLPVAW